MTDQEPADAPQRHPEGPGRVTVARNALDVFVESRAMTAALVADIEAARRRVWIEVYIFENDNAGRAVAAALAKKAREGLDVRVLFDALGSAATPWSMFTEMEKAGAKVHAFHTLWEGLRLFRPFTVLNRRDHRKVFVVDETVAYFGGMNIVDTAKPGRPEDLQKQLGSGSGGVKGGSVESAGWRDVHVRLEGPKAAEVAESFERSWLAALGEKVKRRPRWYRRALLLEEREFILFFDSGPFLKYSRAARVYTRLIRLARHSVTLSMAYFIPVGRVLTVLLAKRRRGVKMRVIVPGNSDVPVVQRATRHLYDRLLRRGFRIYERERRMLHSKVMVVDDQWTVVGSCNMDPRSLWINLEFLAVIRSEAFAKTIGRICRFEMEHSRRVKFETCERLGWRERLLDRLAWAVRWWL